jgi:hypothetical protein
MQQLTQMTSWALTMPTRTGASGERVMDSQFVKSSYSHGAGGLRVEEGLVCCDPVHEQRQPDAMIMPIFFSFLFSDFASCSQPK